ncbi:MAG: hypothetical protein KDC06_11555, partial [Chitinophagaceae bacterium]|nr:hypothetical protein [Chitinophagaceae bacterium]
MDMPGRQYSAGNAYRYGFNGKEKDTEEPVQYDYGFRIYDPRLVRFKSVDPLTSNYPELTPYQYASNNPIKFIDIDGLEGGEDPYYLNSIPRIAKMYAANLSKLPEERQKQIAKNIKYAAGFVVQFLTG